MGKEVNEVKEGYKETEIGVLPEDWDVVRLGAIAKINMGQSPPSETYNTEGIGLPFLQGKAEFGEVYPKPVKWCSKPFKTCDKLSILVSVRAPVGDVNIAPFKCCIGRGLASISPSLKKLIDALFLFYELRFTKSRLQEQGSGTTFQSINRNVLETFLISLPPFSEQRKIAHVLSTIQRAIELQDKVIAATRELKKSLMRHLFTYGPVPVDQVDRVPLKETEIGMVPEHWEVVRLREVADFTKKPRGLNYSGNIPFIPMELIPIGRVNIQKYIIKPSSEISSGVYCEQGDLLLAKITPSFENYKQGIISQIPKPFAFATTEVYPIKARKDFLEILYLFYYLLIPQVRQDIAGKMEGTTGRQRISKSVIQNYLIPIPPLSEQRQIARFLITVDKKIEAEEYRKSTLQSLFQTMLHLLMTGKVRVKDLEVKEDALRQ
ncbi:EcoKI restriction-modification system protein HsdS [Moorella thermoacetica]|uniref:EcoKI restriction-modification system protein HsdS n=1 Tax=Neomoorella thermoacetica TaxID=1525 RepID=A0A1J5NQ16_NEOTH|nr:EcoKI restriction-modification system protein HsdS [Moorella thermoacetica]